MNHSESIDQLAAALVAIQAEVPTIPKDAHNPFFKSTYADLPAVMAAAVPIVTKHGVAVVQTMGYRDGYDTLTNLVVHVSGQWICDTMRLHLVKDDPQGHGSAVTYARRYAYMAALGLVADNDDDGNSASKAKAREQVSPRATRGDEGRDSAARPAGPGGGRSAPRQAPPAASESPIERFNRLAAKAGADAKFIDEILGKETIETGDEYNRVADALKAKAS